jgi:hypothetical protein
MEQVRKCSANFLWLVIALYTRRPKHNNYIWTLMQVSQFQIKYLTFHLRKKKLNIKAIPVTGRGGPQVYETPRLQHFLGNRLTDGGEILNLTRRPPFRPQEDY